MRDPCGRTNDFFADCEKSFKTRFEVSADSAGSAVDHDLDGRPFVNTFPRKMRVWKIIFRIIYYGRFKQRCSLHDNFYTTNVRASLECTKSESEKNGINADFMAQTNKKKITPIFKTLSTFLTARLSEMVSSKRVSRIQ